MFHRASFFLFFFCFSIIETIIVFFFFWLHFQFVFLFTTFFVRFDSLYIYTELPNNCQMKSEILSNENSSHKFCRAYKEILFLFLFRSFIRSIVERLQLCFALVCCC